MEHDLQRDGPNLGPSEEPEGRRTRTCSWSGCGGAGCPLETLLLECVELPGSRIAKSPEKKGRSGR